MQRDAVNLQGLGWGRLDPLSIRFYAFSCNLRCRAGSYGVYGFGMHLDTQETFMFFLFVAKILADVRYVIISTEGGRQTT